MKSLSRLLGGSSRPTPAMYLAAFGKHPGWNDHLDDQGLDTTALVAAKRLLYVQGISQNIDAGAWEKLDPQPADADPTHPFGRLDNFRHDFLWHMSSADASILLAGRLWSSTDGKGRDKYPMVLCAQLTELPDEFVIQLVFPFLAKVHEKCAAAKSAETVRETLNIERENLRARLKDPVTVTRLSAKQVADVAKHPDMRGADAPPPDNGTAEGAAGQGFHRIVYQFAQGMSAYRTPRSGAPRSEKLRLPTCGMTAQEALLFWQRFALTFVDKTTPILLIAPDQTLGNSPAPWVDLIAGEPTPADIFVIKAGTRAQPFTSDIPYTLDPTLVRAIDTHIAHCAAMPENTTMPAWPML